MESLDSLNLRANECSFLEVALTDVRRHAGTFAAEDERRTVLVFPPLSARNRFLIHTLVQNFFNDLNTVSIGNSHGRRTVVYHSSLRPMFCKSELEESNEIPSKHNADMHRPYRTPNERKAQEKLFHSLVPKKNVDKSSISTQRKQSKRPDIPIYVPKARRGSAINNTAPNISNTINSNSSVLCVPDSIDVSTQDASGVILNPKESDSSVLSSNLKNNHINSVPTLLDTIQCVDLSNKVAFEVVDNQIDTSFNISNQISDLSCINHLNFVNSESECNHFPDPIEIHEKINPNVEPNDLKTMITNYNDKSVNSKDYQSHSLSENLINTLVKHSNTDHLSDHQTNNDTIVDLNLQESEKKEKVADNEKTTLDSNQIFVEIQSIVNLENKVIDSNVYEKELVAECNASCLNYCLDNSFSSEPLKDVQENNYIDTNKELTNQISLETVENNVENNKNEIIGKSKKKKKKKVLDVDECCWEDLFDKEDDYIHPLLMKEIVSTMGKVHVKCAKEDYRSHQTIEERSGDGECVIEVYGFSPDLKTVDLMNQFAGFRKKHFEIIWVDDTHALAVFENPNLADQALNTPFALVKTRPLKNATKESKLKAETVTPLPVTRPKTCTAMARRLVSSALGLKMNVSPDLLNAERTLLANAKEKKNRDAQQQKHSIWNDI